MAEIHKGNKWRIIVLIILGVVFFVIGVAALIPGAVFYTMPSEDPEDNTNSTTGLTLLLLGGILGIVGIMTLLLIFAVVYCFLKCCPEELAKDPDSSRATCLTSCLLV